MSSKRKANTTKTKKTKSIQQEIYQRNKRELHRPSAKIGKNWTNEYTKKFQTLWNQLYIDILQNEMNIDNKASQSFAEIKMSPFKFKKKKKPPTHRGRSYTAPNRSAYQSSIYSHKAKIAHSADILKVICKSLQFGVFTLQNISKESKGFESDIVSFWFSIVFNTSYKHQHFLYLKYIKDQMTKSNKSGKVYQSHKIQITCDIEYAQKNNIINAKDSFLPRNVLIEIFKFIQPTRMLALYTYNVEFDTDPFNQKYFNTSNVQWVCNYYGIETYFIRKLFKILISFLNTEEVDKYIENTKTYDKNWKEWQDAQLDLNMMQVHNQMKFRKKRK